MRKVVAVVRGPFTDVVPAGDGIVAFSVHRPHPDEPAAHPEAVHGVAMAWVAGDAPLDPAAWFDAPVAAYLVDERVHIDWTRDWADGTATPAIEQCSFVRRLPGLTRDEFSAHWNDRHAPLVPEEDLRLLPVDPRGNQRRRKEPIAREGRRSARQGHVESPAIANRLRREIHEEKGRGVRDVVGRGKREDVPHGLRQRLPSRARSATDASGPHVPAS